MTYVPKTEPGAIKSDLKFTTTSKQSSGNVNVFYKIAVTALMIARAIAYAIEQPAHLGINEIFVRLHR